MEALRTSWFVASDALPQVSRSSVWRICLPYLLRTQTDKSISLIVLFTPSLHRNKSRCWNINQLSIDYAFRPRLRIRLTLGGLALPRNPWVYGVRVFHPHYRYSCQHSHFRYLQHPSRNTFSGLRNALLPRDIVTSIASVKCLDPRNFRRRIT